MSYITPFNFSDFGPSTFPGAFGQQTPLSYSPNRFASSQDHQFHNAHQTHQTQLPESIAQNYEPQSNNDYYGNPQTYQQQTQTPNFSSYQTYVQNHVEDVPTRNFQGIRKRRLKNRGNRAHAPALTYSQTLGNFQAFQQHPHFGQGLGGRVTPIQGPVYARDGLLPVVPLYAYNAVKNGTLYQIPILWTALSYALGLELRGEALRGLPCIIRLNQLFCPTAGNTYPLDHIERFIDENKALIKRMYGEFVMASDLPGGGPLGSGGGGNALRRTAREVYEHEVEEFFGRSRGTKGSNLAENLKTDPEREEQVSGGSNSTGQGYTRRARQTVNPRNGSPTQQPKSNRVDSCESTVEITTPYWAANSAGKVRAIVNTQHFEQAIQQEVCAKTSTKRCQGTCGCEQKYKWHRLLAYDPDNDCKGIFMDWFLFPSCCVCRCDP